MATSTDTAASPMGIGQFLLALIIRPAKAFQQLADTRKPSWIWPAILMALVIWITPMLTVSITQKEAEIEFEQSIEMFGGENMAPEMKAQMEQSRSFSTSPAFLIAVPAISGTIMEPIFWLSAAGVLYLLSLAMGGHTNFGTVFRVTMWSSVALALRQVFLATGTLLAGATRLPGLQSLVMGNSLTSLPSPFMAGLGEMLARVSIFDLWYVVLIAVGMITIGKISTAKGILLTAIYWIVSLIPPVSLAVIGMIAAQSYMGG